jgi:hypothetical protein
MEDKLKEIIGQFVFQIAALQKQNEELRASLKEKEIELSELHKLNLAEYRKEG